MKGDVLILVSHVFTCLPSLLGQKSGRSLMSGLCRHSESRSCHY